MDRRPRIVVIAVVACFVLGACSGGAGNTRATRSSLTQPSGPSSSAPTATGAAPGEGLPGMPPLVDPRDVYAADRPGQLSPAVASFRPLVYVPNSESNSVDVIDPSTNKVVSHFAVGRLPQHVVPSYDLKTLWV